MIEKLRIIISRIFVVVLFILICFSGNQWEEETYFVTMYLKPAIYSLSVFTIKLKRKRLVKGISSRLNWKRNLPSVSKRASAVISIGKVYCTPAQNTFLVSFVSDCPKIFFSGSLIFL